MPKPKLDRIRAPRPKPKLMSNGKPFDPDYVPRKRKHQKRRRNKNPKRCAQIRRERRNAKIRKYLRRFGLPVGASVFLLVLALKYYYGLTWGDMIPIVRFFWWVVSFFK